jgi:hypothetical protein
MGQHQYLVNLLILAAAAATAAAVFLAVKYIAMARRFKPVLSIDDEVNRVRKELEREKARLTREIEEAKARSAKLGKNYAEAKTVYDRLQHELSMLQEESEDMSFGVYKPHYSFESSEKYKTELDKVYDQKKAAIRNGTAATKVADMAVQRRRQKLMLRAFNGECDAATAKVKWNNVTRMEERIRKAYVAINVLGDYVSITPSYLDLCLAELQLTHEFETKKQEEKEEQREIRERMREEEQAQREFERAQKEAAAEKMRAQKALQAARAELQKATGEHAIAIQQKVEELEQKMAEAQAKQEHAVSMAQLTRMGHVYVISNIGSFGDNVFKIGMTRRLEPEDRVQELGGASVPFGFDIHAMIFSEDAPALESALHRQFSSGRLNLVNSRKEFFRASLDDISEFAVNQGVKLEFTKLAEARQFRESEAIRLKATHAGEEPTAQVDAFPESLFAEEDEESALVGSR